MNLKDIFFLVIQFQLVFANLDGYSCIPEIGRDIYSRIIIGTKYTLFVALISVLLGTLSHITKLLNVYSF